jgi:hypothetical protein
LYQAGDSVAVVDEDGGSNSSFGPALLPPQPLADTARHVRQPSSPNSEASSVDVVETVGGPNSLASFGPALSPAQPLADTTRRIRWPSPPSGETDTGSGATRNDKRRRVINGDDGSGRSGVQIIEGERHQVELEAEPRLSRFACSVGNCRRRYRNIDTLRTYYSTCPL